MVVWPLGQDVGLGLEVVVLERADSVDSGKSRAIVFVWVGGAAQPVATTVRLKVRPRNVTGICASQGFFLIFFEVICFAKRLLVEFFGLFCTSAGM